MIIRSYLKIERAVQRIILFLPVAFLVIEFLDVNTGGGKLLNKYSKNIKCAESEYNLDRRLNYFNVQKYKKKWKAISNFII